MLRIADFDPRASGPMKKIGVAGLGGIFMGLAAAPLSAWYLAWVALIPLWLWVAEAGTHCRRGDRPSTLLSQLAIPLAWGLGYHGWALSWIAGIHPMTWMGVPWLASLAIAVVCWGAIALWGAALVVVWAGGMLLLEKATVKRHESRPYPRWIDSGWRILIGASLWCGLEWLWSQGPLWWSSLAYTQSPHNLAILQLGKISGCSTITALIVAVNGSIAEAFIPLQGNAFPLWRPQRFFILLAIALLAEFHFLGFLLYTQPSLDSDLDAIRVGIVQGNIPNEIKLYPEGWRQAIEGYTTGYKTLADGGVDVVLTPETALPFFWDDFSRHSSLSQAILEKKVAVWLGAFGRRGRKFTNSLFTVTGEGKVFSRFDKIKLVPLGEYIPFEGIFGGIISRLSPLEARLAAGSPDQIFSTPFGQAIVSICYESAFAEHFRSQAARGGEFIITASNNAHYSEAMPAQHHAQDIMRAIETDRWMARATNTGYSAVVDPRGRTVWISGMDTYEVHADTIYRRQGQTLYVRWGDWLTKVLSILAIAGGTVRDSARR